MRFRFITALMAFFFAGQAAHAGQIRQFNIGRWYAGAYTNDATGAFSHCAASAVYNSNIMLLFSVNREFHWSMGLANGAWRLERGAHYPIAFNVDQLPPLQATATAVRRNMILVPLSDSAALFQEFREGNLLHVGTATGRLSFKLTSTSQLLPALVACARNHGKAMTASTNPFVSKSLTPATPNPKANSANGAEATAFAANLLSAAGMNGFRFLTPDQFPRFHGDARWVEASTIGTVDVLPRITPDHLKDLTAALIGRDAKACEGAFLSGAMPAAADTLAHVFTNCETKKSPTIVYYLALPRKAGGAYLVSVASVGSEKPAKQADARITAVVMKAGQGSHAINPQ